MYELYCFYHLSAYQLFMVYQLIIHRTIGTDGFVNFKSHPVYVCDIYSEHTASVNIRTLQELTNNLRM